MPVAGSCAWQHKAAHSHLCKPGSQRGESSHSIRVPVSPAPFIQCRSPAHAVVLVTVRVGFLFSLKPLQKHPNRHTYDFTSSVVLSRVRLTRLTITKVIARDGTQYKQKDAGPVQRTPLPLFPICVKCQPLSVYTPR